MSEPSDVAVTKQLHYGPDRKWHQFELYRPNRYEGRLPVIVNVHGGAYVYGSTKPYRFYCMNLARQQYAVINFNYHLAPKAHYPAALNDVARMMLYLEAHADEYELDLQNVFMIGDSAGAQIASQYATAYSNPAYASLLGIKIPSLRLAALGLNCGIYDVKKELASEQKLNQLVLGDYFADRQAVGIDVLASVTSDFPPSYLMTAPADFLRQRTEEMYHFLREKDVDCSWKLYGDDKTGHVFQLRIRSEVAQEATADELAFFERYKR